MDIDFDFSPLDVGVYRHGCGPDDNQLCAYRVPQGHPVPSVGDTISYSCIAHNIDAHSTERLGRHYARVVSRHIHYQDDVGLRRTHKSTTVLLYVDDYSSDADDEPGAKE